MLDRRDRGWYVTHQKIAAFLIKNHMKIMFHIHWAGDTGLRRSASVEQREAEQFH